MSYLVLARKYRPQTFGGIVGQDYISRALATAIVRGRIPHALLLTGPRGVGKTSVARVFARALNCTGRPAAEALTGLTEEEAAGRLEPCDRCTNCVEIARSTSLAVWEIDGASNNSVDNVRELIESLRSQPPPGARFKIYIIDEVHMLSMAAFNALLKSLEEPPPNTVFIFATTDPQKIPETVISRCQRYDFRRLSIDAIVEQLTSIAGSEGLDIDREVLRLIARKSQGGMRDAQSMLDRLCCAPGTGKVKLQTAQEIFGFVDEGVLFELADAVLRQDPRGCFAILDRLFQQSIDLRAFIGDFVRFWRNLLLFSCEGESMTQAELARALELTEEESREYTKRVRDSFEYQRLFDIAQRTAEAALTGNFPRFALEAGLAKMATLPSLRPLAEIVAQLERGAAQPTKSSRPAPVTAESKREGARPPATWVDFVEYVRGQSEPVLAAFLRRVLPRTFQPGKIHLEAHAFDLTTLREAETIATLKRCLNGYFGEHPWDVEFSERPAAVEAHEVVREIPSRPSGEDPLPGSIVASEIHHEVGLREQIDREAREDPGVQSALATFAGSSIDRVAVLGKGKRSV